MNVAIIPARGGSQRIKRKNIREFHGEPIIAYSIQAAHRSYKFEKVFVSTEDQEIAEIATHRGASVIYRPLALADHETGTQEVMKHALDALPDCFKFACCIYPCAPLILPGYLRSAMECLESRPDMRYIVPVATWLRDDGQFYAGTVEAFKQSLKLLGQKTALLPIDPERAIDINCMDDWTTAEKMYSMLHA